MLYTTVGIVKDTNDPAQQGRVRVYCPSVDHEDYTVDDLPWALYMTPFGGAVKNRKAGPEGDIAYGPTSYGFWAIPKVGSTVVIQFLNGDPNFRIWTGCLYPIQSNRGLPGGRGYDITKSKPYPKGPWTDSYEDIQPTKKNQIAAGLDNEYYQTRGGYERQHAQALTEKDGSDGYASNPNKSDPKDYDPQGYSITTPGGHYLSMDDTNDFCRVRLRTTTGHQILLDDTNERIYVSTNKGKTWFEMDEDGHIHFYAAQSISFTTDEDFNITALNNVNIHAGQDINLKADNMVNFKAATNINLDSGCSTLITCGDNFEVNAASKVNTTSGSTTNILASGNIIQTGSNIHLNGPQAATAAKAYKAPEPGIVPTHEQWNRPKTKGTRNKFWKA